MSKCTRSWHALVLANIQKPSVRMCCLAPGHISVDAPALGRWLLWIMWGVGPNFFIADLGGKRLIFAPCHDMLSMSRHQCPLRATCFDLFLSILPTLPHFDQDQVQRFPDWGLQYSWDCEVGAKHLPRQMALPQSLGINAHLHN